MAEILKNLDITTLPLTSGDNVITATAYATGLDVSEPSAPVIFTEGFLDFTLSASNDYYIVTGIGTFALSNVLIPSKHEGLPVKAIGQGAFAGNQTIRSVEIPASVIRIEETAFSGTAIESITFEEGSNLVQIGKAAFKDCTSLTGIIIPAGVTLIDDEAFRNCKNVKSLVFESANWATIYFRNTRKWETVRFDAYIKNDALNVPIQQGLMTYVENDGQYDIYSATVPFRNDAKRPTVVGIGGYTREGIFDSCNPVEDWPSSDTYQNTVRPISSGCCWEAPEEGRTLIPIRDYVPPETGLRINSKAFYGLMWLPGPLVIPDNVVYIGESAFFGADCITSVELGMGVRRVEDSAFESCNTLSRIVLGRSVSVISLNDGMPYDDDIISRVINHIGKKAFAGTRATIDSTVIPDSVTWIGAQAYDFELTALSFEDKYGWFYTLAEDASGGTPLSSSSIDNPGVAAGHLTSLYAAYNWYKLDKMPAPTLSLSGQNLSILDTTGIAESFDVYVNGIRRATIYADE